MSDEITESNSIAINEAQLVLAEKRTSLSVMRTGIAVLALPLSVMSVLIATSKYYDVINVLFFLIPLGITHEKQSAQNHKYINIISHDLL